jgi:exodeoxyribonuclease VII large subunit
LLGPQRQRADDAGQRLDRGLERRVTLARGALDRSSGALRPATLQQQVTRNRDRLAATWRLVQSLNPDAVLDRGYARVTARTGETLSSAAAVHEAGAVTLRFRDGSIDALVDDGVAQPAPMPAKVERKPARAYV